MFKVMFEDAWYRRTEIGKCETEDAARSLFSQYLKEKGIKSYYQRIWLNDNSEIVIDYGSHGSFGIIIPNV